MDFDIWTIVSAVLGLVAVVAGDFFLKAKGKLKQIADLIKEAYEVMCNVTPGYGFDVERFINDVKNSCKRRR